MRGIRLTFALLVVGVAGTATFAEPASWTLTNHAGDYENELVRLKVALDAPPDPQRTVVTEDGKPVPFQVGETGGVWVATTIGAGVSHTYEVRPGKPPAAEPLVTIREEAGACVLDNGLLAVKVPAGPAGGGGPVPGPILAVRSEGGAWMGASRWTTRWPMASVRTTVLGRGPLFAKVSLVSEGRVPPNVRAEPPRSEVTLTLKPGERVVHVEESHRMHEGDSWTFDCAAGWQPTGGTMRRWHVGPFKGSPGTEKVALEPGQTRLGETLLNLQPRWTQSFDEGWFFGATDGRTVVGAIPARAGRWYWGHDNLIRVKLKGSADYAGLECPTWRGRRYWLLVAGPAETVETRQEPDPRREGRTRKVDGLERLVTRAAFQPLNKLVHDYILEWPGTEPGGFRGAFFYSNSTNPTGARRGMGRGALAGAGRRPGDRRTLSTVQVNLDPDWFCGYWQRWGPINPNFHTDFIKYPVGEACNLTAHPRFEEIARRVEDVVRTDLYYAVTLPGGAGQECPGYLAHSMGSWKQMADVCRKHLGFDLTTWPRYRAAGSFIAHLSQPVGGGKRAFHPGGDTHPGRPDPLEFARGFGADVDPGELETEELPGFGVVFRNRPDTDRETYLAFKAGPNRGHFHGDQLAFHYCARARPVAVDHHCSYKPRAGQEHMHNRVAFHTDAWPYANMDGFERVLAVRTDDPEVDVAVGQVESSRLRKQLKLPPEEWDAIGPLERFDRPLVYRRTVVLVKGRPEDYFVLRDEYTGPELSAVYCLHVLAERVERRGPTVRWPNLTLFCAAPTTFEFERFPWEHDNGGREHTEGVRLRARGADVEFITGLYPGPKPPEMTATPRGVRLDFGDGADLVEFAAAGVSSDADAALVRFERDGRSRTVLRGRDIDPDRSQGEVGLFIPDVGYPFGPMPAWLERQRDTVPDWHRPWP